MPEVDGYKVTSIGDYGFSDCKSLISITIPNSTTQPITTEPTTTTTTQPTTTQSPKGDTNGDGKVSIADARKIVVAIAKNDTVAMIEFGDVNGDGKISVADVRKIVVAIAKNDFNF